MGAGDFDPRVFNDDDPATPWTAAAAADLQEHLADYTDQEVAGEATARAAADAALAAQVAANTTAIGTKANSSTVTSGLAGKISSSEKGAPSGVAPLDSDGKVPSANLPPSGGSGVPVGGTTGQVLAKTSNVDGAATWQTPDVTQAELDAETARATAAEALAVLKSGSTMTGPLTLSADPTNALHAATRQYVLAQINALINGAPGALDTLNEIAVQLGNDESVVSALTTTVAGKLAKTSNLSDLASASTARTNLGLGNVDNTADSSKPVSTAQATALAAKTNVFTPTGEKTAAYTAAPGDLITVNATSASVPIALPSAPADKTQIIVKVVAVGTPFAAVINRGGSDVFNRAGGNTSLRLDAVNQAVILQYQSSTGVWFVNASDAGKKPPVEVSIFGHSFTGGTGGTNATSLDSPTGTTTSRWGYPSRLCKAFGAVEMNKGVGGTKVMSNQTGGWPAVPIMFSQDPRQSAEGLSAKTQVVLLDWGVNELGNSQAGYVHAMRSAICYSRMASQFRSNHASVSGTGGFSGAASNVGYSGDLCKPGVANGDTFTIAVPSWFPGGEIDVFVYGTSTKGAIISFTVDGAADASPLNAVTPNDISASTYTACVKRFTGLAAGAHTIVGTVSSLTGGAVYLESWTMSAPTPPLVIVQNLTPTQTFSTPTYQPTFNGLLSTLVAEFPAAEVKLLDRSTPIGAIWAAAGAYLSVTPDGTHPNDYVHGLIAAMNYDLILASSYPPAQTLLRA